MAPGVLQRNLSAIVTVTGLRLALVKTASLIPIGKTEFQPITASTLFYPVVVQATAPEVVTVSWAGRFANGSVPSTPELSARRTGGFAALEAGGLSDANGKRDPLGYAWDASLVHTVEGYYSLRVAYGAEGYFGWDAGMVYVAELCGSSGQRTLPDGGCQACPSGTGLKCPGGNRFRPEAGFVLIGSGAEVLPCGGGGSTAVERCPEDSSSAGCAAAYRGSTCHTCAEGYYSLAGRCAVCPAPSAMQVAVVLGAFGILAAVILVYATPLWRSKPLSPRALRGLGFCSATLQAVYLSGFLFSLENHAPFVATFYQAVLGVLVLDPGTSLSECAAGALNRFELEMALTLGHLLLAILISGIVTAVRRKPLAATLAAVGYCGFATVLVRGLKGLLCKATAAERRLHFDTGLVCFRGRHIWVACAAIAILLGAGGGSLALLVRAWRRGWGSRGHGQAPLSASSPGPGAPKTSEVPGGIDDLPLRAEPVPGAFLVVAVLLHTWFLGALVILLDPYPRGRAGVVIFLALLVMVYCAVPSGRGPLWTRRLQLLPWPYRISVVLTAIAVGSAAISGLRGSRGLADHVVDSVSGDPVVVGLAVVALVGAALASVAHARFTSPLGPAPAEPQPGTFSLEMAAEESSEPVFPGAPPERPSHVAQSPEPAVDPQRPPLGPRGTKAPRDDFLPAPPLGLEREPSFAGSVHLDYARAQTPESNSSPSPLPSRQAPSAEASEDDRVATVDLSTAAARPAADIAPPASRRNLRDILLRSGQLSSASGDSAPRMAGVVEAAVNQVQRSDSLRRDPSAQGAPEGGSDNSLKYRSSLRSRILWEKTARLESNRSSAPGKGAAVADAGPAVAGGGAASSGADLHPGSDTAAGSWVHLNGGASVATASGLDMRSFASSGNGSAVGIPTRQPAKLDQSVLIDLPAPSPTPLGATESGVPVMQRDAASPPARLASTRIDGAPGGLASRAALLSRRSPGELSVSPAQLRKTLNPNPSSPLRNMTERAAQPSPPGLPSPAMLKRRNSHGSSHAGASFSNLLADLGSNRDLRAAIARAQRVESEVYDLEVLERDLSRPTPVLPRRGFDSSALRPKESMGTAAFAELEKDLMRPTPLLPRRVPGRAALRSLNSMGTKAFDDLERDLRDADDAAGEMLASRRGDGASAPTQAVRTRRAYTASATASAVDSAADSAADSTAMHSSRHPFSRILSARRPDSILNEEVPAPSRAPVPEDPLQDPFLAEIVRQEDGDWATPASKRRVNPPSKPAPTSGQAVSSQVSLAPVQLLDPEEAALPHSVASKLMALRSRKDKGKADPAT